MDITTIMMFSMILWVFLDRAKKLWENVSWGKWVTTGVAAAAGLAMAFAYGMDLFAALGISTASVGGKVFAGLAMAGGSSVINEVITGIKKTSESK